jgi:hypothetical protein
VSLLWAVILLRVEMAMILVRKHYFQALGK